MLLSNLNRDMFKPFRSHRGLLSWSSGRMREDLHRFFSEVSFRKTHLREHFGRTNKFALITRLKHLNVSGAFLTLLPEENREDTGVSCVRRPQQSPTFGPPEQSCHGTFWKLGNFWADTFLWFVPEITASRKFRSSHVLWRKSFSRFPFLWFVPELCQHGVVVVFLVRWGPLVFQCKGPESKPRPRGKPLGMLCSRTLRSCVAQVHVG